MFYYKYRPFLSWKGIQIFEEMEKETEAEDRNEKKVDSGSGSGARTAWILHLGKRFDDKKIRRWVRLGDSRGELFTTWLQDTCVLLRGVFNRPPKNVARCIA